MSQAFIPPTYRRAPDEVVECRALELETLLTVARELEPMTGRQLFAMKARLFVLGWPFA